MLKGTPKKTIEQSTVQNEKMHAREKGGNKSKILKDRPEFS